MAGDKSATGGFRRSRAAMPSMSMRAARISNVTAIHATGSVLPPLANCCFTIVTNAQELMAYINTAGIPVTKNTQIACRVRHNHTVTPNNVNAASN